MSVTIREGAWYRLANGEICGPARVDGPLLLIGGCGYKSNGECWGVSHRNAIEEVPAPTRAEPDPEPEPIDDGGPAFHVAAIDGVHGGHDGMSLRDWLAGQALAGLMATPNGPRLIKEAAKASWNIADAMLRARKVKR